MTNKLQVKHSEQPMGAIYSGNEIDRMFDMMMDAATSPFGLLASLAPARPRTKTVENRFMQPRMSIEGDETAWRVAVEVPGVDEKDLHVEMKDNTLIISGEKKYQAEGTNEKGIYHMERSFGSFRRVVAVPEDIKAEAISASYKNGVLEVTLPREPKEEKLRKIEITQG